MDTWAKEQFYGKKQIYWYEMKKAVQQVVDQAFEEYQKYNESIEKYIIQQQIEI